MVSKFEMLAALVDAEAEQIRDEVGYHHTLVGVLRRLDELDRGELKLEDLADVLYADIQRSIRIDPFHRDDGDD